MKSSQTESIRDFSAVLLMASHRQEYDIMNGVPAIERLIPARAESNRKFASVGVPLQAGS